MVFENFVYSVKKRPRHGGESLKNAKGFPEETKLQGDKWVELWYDWCINLIKRADGYEKLL